MKIERDRSKKMWTLTSGSHVLYCGRRSPWEDPAIMRDALHRARELDGPARLTPSSRSPQHP
ncbi:MAG TPA: hypothetical protein VLA56_00420 [Pseudomonadales bacterium]|nr:hypothetical protein [Pseudomonadales bacterium]